MRKLGFTIIEVSVAITLLGIFLAIGTLGLQNYLAGARDRERKDDLQSIATHLENYYRDHGQYPSIAQFTKDDDTPKDPRETLNRLAIDDITAPNQKEISFKTGINQDNLDINTYIYTPTCTETGKICHSFILATKLENNNEAFTIESKHQ